MDRLARLRALLAERDLEAALIALAANRYFLTGFPAHDHGPDESAGLLIVDGESATIVTGATNAPWAEGTVRPGVDVAVAERPWERAVGERLRAYRRVGFEDAALTIASHQAIRESAGDAVALQPLGNGVSALRAVKEPGELDLMARIIGLTDEVFVAATAGLTAGTTERQLARRIDRTMLDLGADGPAFPTIVAAGPHGARPHHTPTDRSIAPGEPVIIDMGVALEGYSGDLTRTIWVGEPTERLRAIYNVVYDAQRAALVGLRAGLSGKDADALAREPIAAAGYGEHFTHGLGHGLGIRVHEAPSLGKKATDPLQPGQVVTVEPGIYIEGWGGVRIEDVGVVETNAFRNLTAAPKPNLAGG
jgi:Xaa-Pro aminopeptidase